jgi:transcriptional regulator with XRE-family HTH domain
MSVTPGQELKAAREALGKSTSEMAQATRITMQQLQGLEADDYSSIPAPMYVRGFIKLYAQELGLNPEPLVARYEEIRTGVAPENRSAARERGGPEVPRPETEASAPDAPPAGKGPVSREKPRQPVLSGGGIPSGDGGSWFGRLILRLRNSDFGTVTEADWWLKAKPPRILAGLLFGLILVVGLRSCGGGGGEIEAGGGTPSAETEPPAPVSEMNFPAIEDPLIRHPHPVLFDLPRTLE